MKFLNAVKLAYLKHVYRQQAKAKAVLIKQIDNTPAEQLTALFEIEQDATAAIVAANNKRDRLAKEIPLFYQARTAQNRHEVARLDSDMAHTLEQIKRAELEAIDKASSVVVEG